MLGKEALLLSTKKSEPMLSIPNGWGDNMATMYFKDKTSMSLSALDSRFPDRKVPISLLAERTIYEDGIWFDMAPSVVNVRIADHGTGHDYYVDDRTKDAEIRW